MALEARGGLRARALLRPWAARPRPPRSGTLLLAGAAPAGQCLGRPPSSRFPLRPGFCARFERANSGWRPAGGRSPGRRGEDGVVQGAWGGRPCGPAGLLPQWMLAGSRWLAPGPLLREPATAGPRAPFGTVAGRTLPLEGRRRHDGAESCLPALRRSPPPLPGRKEGGAWARSPENRTTGGWPGGPACHCAPVVRLFGVPSSSRRAAEGDAGAALLGVCCVWIPRSVAGRPPGCVGRLGMEEAVTRAGGRGAGRARDALTGRSIWAFGRRGSARPGVLVHSRPFTSALGLRPGRRFRPALVLDPASCPKPGWRALERPSSFVAVESKEKS